MALKIALYYPYIHLRSGIEKTILEILKRSRHDWTVFTNLFEKNSTYSELNSFSSRIVQLKKISVKRSYFNTLLTAFTIFKQKLPLESFDILWVHNEGLGSLINFKNRGKPSICFCHTPLKIVYDKSLRTSYLAKNSHKLLFYLLFSSLFKLLDRKAFSLYEWCFCVSNEVKKRVVENRLFSESKIGLVYRGADLDKSSLNVNYGNYFFHPTRIKWWKNIELSIEAFRIFKSKCSGANDFKLVISGQVYPTSQSYYKKLLKLISSDRDIVFLVNPSQEQINDLYLNCLAVLSTTMNEDFGLTVLESFSFAKAVIAINRGGPSEIISNGRTGLLSDSSARNYAECMIKLANDKRNTILMGKSAREVIVKYGWGSFIKEMDNFLDNFIKRRRVN